MQTTNDQTRYKIRPKLQALSPWCVKSATTLPEVLLMNLFTAAISLTFVLSLFTFRFCLLSGN
jgi:hypothetical protein